MKKISIKISQESELTVLQIYISLTRESEIFVITKELFKSVSSGGKMDIARLSV